MPLAHFEKIVKVNLIGTFNVTRLVRGRLADRAGRSKPASAASSS